jgi:hypothetical protein
VCQGRETYYWALFDLPPHYFAKRPYSHGQFLKDQHEALQRQHIAA